MDPISAAIASVVGLGSTVFGGKTAKDIAKLQAKTAQAAQPQAPAIDAGFMRNVGVLADTSSFIAEALAARSAAIAPSPAAPTSNVGVFALVGLAGLVLFLVTR